MNNTKHVEIYENMQAQRNEYAKNARVAERNGDEEKAEIAKAEVKFLNKRLREMHRTKFYKQPK